MGRLLEVFLSSLPCLIQCARWNFACLRLLQFRMGALTALSLKETIVGEFRVYRASVRRL